ncbi:MAG: hypothetical protein K8W52_20675, partial [Deltaproteobacteria bacterium]|nr:hypothetical protein [Deltaproteobacteria bacterium]
AIREDAVALPALPAIAPAIAVARPAWRWWLGGGALALAAAALALVVLPREPQRDPARGAQVAVKGAGVVVVSAVRDRDGAIAFDPSGFRTSDRWKLRVTCAPGAAVWADAVVLTDGDPAPAFPLAAQRIACGNQIVLAGAFRLTDAAPSRLCVALASADAGPIDRAAIDPAALACVAVAPEP